MPHIDLDHLPPGIVGLLHYRPDTGRVLSELAEVLLRGPGSLSPGERELIAASVSRANECRFCAAAHGACAAEQLPGGAETVEQAASDPEHAEISDRLKALLRIAELVRIGGHQVTAEDVAAARERGASDRDIHDAVLIAASFSMFNRYVDGLDTALPPDPIAYPMAARQIVADGYLALGP